MKKIIDEFGTICYYNENDEYHREDGPAIEYKDGRILYYYNDIYYPNIKSDEKWKKFVKLMVFK